MPITTHSAKAKGRRLQMLVRDAILDLFPRLKPEDVRSTSSGAGGVDVQLSTAAARKFPYRIETKNLKKHSVYSLWDQAVSHKGPPNPLLIIKSDRREPLAVITLEHFMELVKDK